MKLVNLINNNLILEAESLFKRGIVKSTKKTRVEWFWFHSSLPASIDVDFKFQVVFDIKNIKRDYYNKSWNDFYVEVIKPNFSERHVWIKSKYLLIDGFKVDSIVYNSEITDKALNPKRNRVYKFRHTAIIEATDKNKVYKKAEIEKIVEKFAQTFESIVYKDTEYYKIIK